MSLLWNARVNKTATLVNIYQDNLENDLDIVGKNNTRFVSDCKRTLPLHGWHQPAEKKGQSQIREQQTPGHYRALFYSHQKPTARQESTQKLPFSLTNWRGVRPPQRSPKCTDSLCASLGTAQLGSPADKLDHQQNPHVRHTTLHQHRLGFKVAP